MSSEIAYQENALKVGSFLRDNADEETIHAYSLILLYINEIEIRNLELQHDNNRVKSGIIQKIKNLLK